MNIVRWTTFPMVMSAVGVGAALALGQRWLPPEAVPLVVALATLPIALVLERVVPRRSRTPEPGETATDLAWLVLNGALSRPVAEAAAAGIVVAFASAWGRGPAADWSIAAQAGAGFLVMELGTYARHRAMHEVPWLWRLHAVHHAPTTMRALNNARQHPLELGVQTGLTLLPALLLGIGPEALAWLASVRAAHLWFGHIDADLRYGPLNYVLNTASVHRWHHASSRTSGGMANYGELWVGFDHLFGTFHLPPEVEEPEAMGLSGDTAYPRHQLLRTVVAPWCWERCTERR